MKFVIFVLPDFLKVYMLSKYRGSTFNIPRHQMCSESLRSIMVKIFIKSTLELKEFKLSVPKFDISEIYSYHIDCLFNILVTVCYLCYFRLVQFISRVHKQLLAFKSSCCHLHNSDRIWVNSLSGKYFLTQPLKMSLW